MKKGVVIALVSLAVLLLAATVAGGFYMVGYALVDADRDLDYEETARIMDERVPGIYEWYSDLLARGVFRDTSIVNGRGFRQYAVYASAADPDNARGTAVLAHGYTDNMVKMMPIARMYRDSLNFNILVFDQQFHGRSEGEAIQMGWLDRHNAALWAEVADNIWHSAFLMVHGVSMGGATTMMLSGDPDPDCVSAYVEDCGFSSVWNQFAKELKLKFGLPSFPLLNCAGLICRARYGWGFKQASSLDMLARSTKPVLFIHGDSDSYVPTADVYRCYEAKTRGFKQMYIAEGATHAKAFDKNPARYTAAVRDFIASVKKGAGEWR